MADLDIHYDPITVTNNPQTVTFQGLDNIKDAISLATPQPLKSETKSEIDFPNPIKTDGKFDLTIEPIQTTSKAELDIKPLEFDQSLTIRLAPLPPTCVRQPYRQHLGLTLFGVEVFGLNLEGENEVILTDLPRKPQVDWGGEAPAPRQRISEGAVSVEGDGGLRIRLGH